MPSAEVFSNQRIGKRVLFQTRLQQCGAAVQGAFDSEFARYPAGQIVDAMAYATRGGKRLRAFLVMEAARLHGVDDAQSVWAATAIEAMHAYSLVHDDLPAMDDDDHDVLLITRGKEPQVGCLAFPGGHIDYNESPEDACIRELKEEC